MLGDRVGIMYAGEIVETAPRDEFFRSPAHPYSKKLLASLPGRDRREVRLRLAPALSRGQPSLCFYPHVRSEVPSNVCGQPYTSEIRRYVSRLGVRST